MMAVLVTNESGDPYVFEGSGGRRQIGAGDTLLVSDQEWATVISAYRGSGKLNPQPLPVDASVTASVTPAPAYALAVRVDDVGGTPDVTYVGEANPGSLTSDPVWRIKRLTDDGTEFITTEWVNSGAFNQIWDDRVSLTYS
jgi:hypothetical protein